MLLTILSEFEIVLRLRRQRNLMRMRWKVRNPRFRQQRILVTLLFIGYWASSDTVVEGEFQIGGQYHFYMETLVSLCIPTEDGVDLYCATQDQDAVQNVVAQSLRIDKCR